MADVELVIKISEELKNKIDNANDDNYRTYIWWFETTLYCAIKEGIILPKGHGKLIDADEALKAMDTWDKFGFEHTGSFVRNPKDDFIKYVHYDDMVHCIKNMPTVIETDKEGNI